MTQSDALEALHGTAAGLHHIGLIDAKKMRHFDASCLTTVEKLSAKIKSLNGFPSLPSLRPLL
jgi:putative transcriptional regulator